MNTKKEKVVLLSLNKNEMKDGTIYRKFWGVFLGDNRSQKIYNNNNDKKTVILYRRVADRVRERIRV